ncbi:hypothetical protein PMR49_10155, partial [Bifidobacterium longum]|nr:hypothetical protein [Bifidobacterium longum]
RAKGRDGRDGGDDALRGTREVNVHDVSFLIQPRTRYRYRLSVEDAGRCWLLMYGAADAGVPHLHGTETFPRMDAWHRV